MNAIQYYRHLLIHISTHQSSSQKFEEINIQDGFLKGKAKLI